MGVKNHHAKDGTMETDKRGALMTPLCHSFNTRMLFSGKPICRDSNETDVQSQLK